MADTLNTAQRQAVDTLTGPCLVLAGAGSGKTRVIVHKIARLLQSGLAPERIAAITFTNKAAAEMRERAKALVGPRAARPLVISTFHSFGVRLLREHGERVGLKARFSILDSDDVLSVLRDELGLRGSKFGCGMPVAPPTPRWRAAGNGPSAAGRTRGSTPTAPRPPQPTTTSVSPRA